MKIDPKVIDTLDYEEVIAFEQRAVERRKTLEALRKKAAIEQARTALAAAGLTFEDALTGGVRSKPLPARKPKKPLATYRSGCRYQHPRDPQLVWGANGKKPGWLRHLEESGERAIELGGNQAHLEMAKSP
jgi:DNA-binding protein H-NS